MKYSPLGRRRNLINLKLKLEQERKGKAIQAFSKIYSSLSRVGFTSNYHCYEAQIEYFNSLVEQFEFIYPDCKYEINELKKLLSDKDLAISDLKLV